MSNSQLVFTGGWWTNWNMYTVNTDGTGLAQLMHSTNTVEVNPTVSQGGSKIAFQRRIGGVAKWDIWIMDSNGQNAKQLTDNGASYDPLFVNDKIVFYGKGNDGDRDIYSMNFDGSGVIQLTDTAEQDMFDLNDWNEGD